MTSKNDSTPTKTKIQLGDQVTTPALSGGKELAIPGTVIAVTHVGAVILYAHLGKVGVVPNLDVITVVSRPAGPALTVPEAYRRAAVEAEGRLCGGPESEGGAL